MELDIIYQDEDLIGINKPNGMFVHKTRLAPVNENGPYALQLLRDQIGQKVYPVHRIDRKTSGVLIFALSKDTERLMQMSIAGREVSKEYLAIVRGYVDEEGEIDYPLRKENGQIQQAITNYKRLDQTELDLPYGSHTTSRYSLVHIFPQTGRMHQIRKHFAHIDHPIIGDRPHGCNKQNRLFREKWNMTTMMLHSFKYTFIHPVTGDRIQIRASVPMEFKRILKVLKFEHNLKMKEI